MKFEIINPSDKAFVEGNDFETICFAISLLSFGRYGLKEVDGTKRMPILMFPETGWWSRTFNKTVYDSAVSIDKKEIAKVLRTVKLAYRRSSVTDIVRNAKNLAEVMESF